MRLYRYLWEEKPCLGILDGEEVIPAEAIFELAGYSAPEAVRHADLKTIAGAPDAVVVRLQETLKEAKQRGVDRHLPRVPLSQVRPLAPIPRPGKFICVGLNYRDHCEEQNLEPPKSPVLFAKFANAIANPGDEIRKPQVTSKLDFEGELGVVIGRGGKHIPQAEALDHVFGYTIVNDVSARDVQKQDGQWLRAKSMDGFAPIGPCITTTDEIPDPQTLALRTTVNGVVMQDSHTSRMIFSVAMLIEFISRCMTLEPGDIISTGTPSGVGVWRNPPVFLQDGDVVRIEIERIGVLQNTVRWE